MIVDEGKYFLYRHIRLDKNEPFYIGVGTIRDRVLNSKTKSNKYERAFTKGGRSELWKHIVNKSKYRIDIILETFDIEFIYEKEKEFIKLYGRKDLGLGSLANHTDGGEGLNNYIVTEERRKSISANTIKLYENKDKPIYKYSLAGNFIERFKNSFDLSSSYNRRELRNIINCCSNNNIRFSSNFIWSYEKLTQLEILTNKNICTLEYMSTIFEYNLQNEFIKKWENVFEIFNHYNSTKGERSGIRNCLLGDYFSSCGKIWKYVLTDTPSVLINKEFLKIPYRENSSKFNVKYNVLIVDRVTNDSIVFTNLTEVSKFLKIKEITVKEHIRKNKNSKYHMSYQTPQ